MVQPPYSAPSTFSAANYHDHTHEEGSPADAGQVEKRADAALGAALRTGLIAGAMASVVSTVALALAGRRETGSAVAPTNAISHWLWGGEALAVDRPTLRHTAVGYAIHHLSSTFWAVLYAWLHGNRQDAQTVPKAMAGATVASALACLVDYKATPKRLTPGFEHRLSTGAMALVYGAFAVGLAAGCLAANRRSSP
ncbi:MULTISPECIES: hypothetical protein [unclassified Variovorax]|uniref:hypothetical protein n=1 Tax=unclassified Variovorax TaxID=663243 RepID=UPI00076BC130|nr:MULTISPECIES: hypothetical protein [unclassified Variovorax]KWT94077.1 hypothetical protein APY03_2673 [Variovorax sp. WDL1]PNG59962.1 hypothetical protein CHC07_01691 [Variovorax sp. B4]PNG60246.1 hypothetical protein CHC06_00143 [Variovorax sp. B2]VTV13919.1 hypothetical protein WDL1CHR_04528 [Variovorax sp. WDL1]